MAETKQHIQHIRSSVKDKKPTVSNLEYGELGINFNKESMALYAKNSEDEIVQIGGDLSNFVVKQELKDVEEVVSETFNKTKKSLGFDEQMNYTPSASAYYISSASTVTDALDTLDSVLNGVDETYGNITLSSNIRITNLEDKLKYVTSPDGVGNFITVSEGDTNASIHTAYYGISLGFDDVIEEANYTKGTININTDGITMEVLNDANINVNTNPSFSNSKFLYNGKEVATVDDIPSGIELADDEETNMFLNVTDGKLSITGILDNENVTATAFNKINTSVGLDEKGNFVVDEDSKVISEATSVVEALQILDTNVGAIPSDVYTKTEVDNTFVKQETLADNFKTVNGESIVGEGDIVIDSGLELSDDEETNKFLSVTDDKLSLSGILDIEKVVAETFARFKGSAGFNDNGRLIISGTNYLDGKTSILQCLLTLDSVLKTIMDSLS